MPGEVWPCPCCGKRFLEEDATRSHATSTHNERFEQGEIESEEIWSDDEVPEAPSISKYKFKSRSVSD